MSTSSKEHTTKPASSCISQIEKKADTLNIEPSDEGEYPAVEFLLPVEK